MMLDPGHPALEPVEVPGLAHLPLLPIEDRDQPFRLLHAKVALLGFRSTSEEEGWLARLIVSTGNWTRQTLEESLDLIWCIDVESNELDDEDDDLALRCADLSAAWSLFQFLHGAFDLRILDAARHGDVSESRLASHELTSWLSACTKIGRDCTPRFIDNREASFLSQLNEAIKHQAGSSKRNYLAMGSGFFEGASANRAPAVPAVLDAVFADLVSHGLLTKGAEVNLFVNPAACQAVAHSQGCLPKQWQIYPASKMESVFGPNSQRSLHAKFLFSASERDDNNRCIKPWVYLGSGNLTGPGFSAAMSRHAGNLEAGVVFAPNELQWYSGRGVDPDTLVSSYLPLQWDQAITPQDGLHEGGRMPERDDSFVAPPIAWLAWRQDTETCGYLIAPSGASADYEVLSVNGDPCAPSEQGFVWLGNRPRQVRLRWSAHGQAQECLVPVMDELGRLAATPLTALDFDEAWLALVSFPATSDEDADAENDNRSGQLELGGGGGRTNGVASYPIRQMMELVEQIAARQTQVYPADWTAWCARLEQTLSRIAEDAVLDYFRRLGLNPLSPLRVAAFRPDFAEDATSAEGQLYEAMLHRIETHWQTTGLAAIGESA
ncbi:hypothetical protein G3480_21165 [Thiorhodococcus mannitoliphagus]|uniref:Uncharacterized protein n=1 Tax=Thiorhodococcus mannitoliphagus TaxID=329406 RepID=A0A6P1E2Q8_9GAMM|nr:hypothetical protein [Thiorhodococcus mannitoliphagus]NEX22782.1 hypothetical protein [Thiorhodococcus mannitoliphagus]